jgi:hypothetical protein
MQLIQQTELNSGNMSSDLLHKMKALDIPKSILTTLGEIFDLNATLQLQGESPISSSDLIQNFIDLFSDT